MTQVATVSRLRGDEGCSVDHIFGLSAGPPRSLRSQWPDREAAKSMPISIGTWQLFIFFSVMAIIPLGRLFYRWR